MFLSVANPIIHIFPLISIAGLYLVSSLMICSGLAQAFVDSQGEAPFRLLPDGETSVKTYYTGFRPIDSYLANLQFIFVPLVDGSSPQLSLLGWHWAGLLLALFTVMLVESLRSRRKRDLTFFVLWGLTIQYCGYFAAMPVYSYVHLSRSTNTASNEIPFPELDTIAILGVPISMLLGYVIPSVIMCLPKTHSGQSRQLAVAFWQNFPVWIALVQLFVLWLASRCRALRPGRLEELAAHSRTTTASSHQYGALLSARTEEHSISIRKVYKVTAVAALLIHISGLLPIVLAIVWPEGLISISPLPLSATNVLLLQPRAFFLPAKWDSQVRISSMVDGAWNFLRYDYYIGTAAALLWAAFLQLPHHRERSQKYNAVKGGNKWLRNEGIGQILTVVASAVVFGPGFTIVRLISEREGNLLEISKKRQY